MGLGLTKVLRIPLLEKLLGPSETDEIGFGRMIANARALIDARLQRGTEKRSDMLASFVRHGLDADELITESTLQVIAGSDRCVLLAKYSPFMLCLPA